MSETLIPIPFDSLDPRDQELVRRSEQALSSSYAPYSQFHVGTALLMIDDTIITGSNQENVAYPSGLCAERVAMFHAGSQHPGKRIDTITVVARPSGHPELVPVTPCGACRQVMLEIENKQKHPIRVVMMLKPDQWIIAPSASFLLPYSFSSGDLRPNK